MYLKTVSEAAHEFGLPVYKLRRDIAAGKYAHIRIGDRLMVDIDDMRYKLQLKQHEAANIMSIAELSEFTGMSESMIRRAIHEGYLSSERDGRKIILRRDVALDEINRMLAGDVRDEG